MREARSASATGQVGYGVLLVSLFRGRYAARRCLFFDACSSVWAIPCESSVGLLIARPSDCLVTEPAKYRNQSPRGRERVLRS